MPDLKLIARIALFCLVFAAGCTVPPKEQEPIKIKNPERKGDTEVSCNIEDHRHLVGKDYQEVKSELPQHRWKRPGYMYSQEYISDRLNIVTDENGIIIAVKCG